MRVRRARGAVIVPLLVLIAALLAGCGTTFKLVPEPLTCPVSEELLAQRCSEPVAVGETATFGDVLTAGLKDRDALRICALRREALVAIIVKCNQDIEDYRGRLRKALATP